jgi:hypothetical protein
MVGCVAELNDSDPFQAARRWAPARGIFLRFRLLVLEQVRSSGY